MDKLIAQLPNVYYHVVGRLLPGAAVLTCLVFFSTTRSLVLAPDGSYVWTVILAGGYAVGAMLTASSALVFNVLLDLYSAPAPAECRRPLGQRIGHVAEKDPSAAIGLWKMVAETALVENLFIGSVCLAAIDTYSLGVRATATLFWIFLLFGLYFVSLERKHLLLVRLAQAENVLDIQRSVRHDVAALGV